MYSMHYWRAGIFFTNSRLHLPLKKSWLPAPGSRFYKFLLPAPALAPSFKDFYRLPINSFMAPAPYDIFYHPRLH